MISGLTTLTVSDAVKPVAANAGVRSTGALAAR